MAISFWRKPSLQQLDERIRERRFGRRPIDQNEPELLVWIGGDRAIEESLNATLKALASLRPDGPIAFLMDGSEAASIAAPLLTGFSARRELVAPQQTALPALLLGRALASSAHRWCGFVWAGCEISASALPALAAVARVSPADIVHGDLPLPVPREVSVPLQRGWMEITDLVPMHHALVRADAVRRYGGLIALPMLQRTFWWELSLRLARHGRIGHAAVAAPATRWNWSTYPFTGPDATTPDLAARFAVRRDLDPERFLADLPARTAADAEQRLSAWSRSHSLRSPDRTTVTRAASLPFPLRITIVSESIDAHHNELFYYSYFVRVAGKEKLTWRAITYERCRADDLASTDLVIMTRPRFPEVPALLDVCDAMKLPVLVMIDDNWFAAGREYPRYERLFTPGRPAFDVFLESLRRADAVLVFNKLIAEDVAPHARRVVHIPPNVDFLRFSANASRSRDRLLVAFAGSPRWERSAFRALQTFLVSDDQSDLLIIAHEIPPEIVGLPATRLTFVPWQEDVDQYARSLAAAAPDILLAPLDATRFTASKLPMKWFDAAAVGAAGIFSRVPPYSDEVHDGEDGILVENTDDAWLDALQLLSGDGGLRRRIATTARQRVESRYSTDRLLNSFLEMLANVVAGARRRRS